MQIELKHGPIDIGFGTQGSKTVVSVHATGEDITRVGGRYCPEGEWTHSGHHDAYAELTTELFEPSHRQGYDPMNPQVEGELRQYLTMTAVADLRDLLQKILDEHEEAE